MATATQCRLRRTERLGRTLLFLTVVALAACTSERNVADDGASGAGDPPAQTPIAATLEWAPASGPVAAYQIFESRDGAGYEKTEIVPAPSVMVEGLPGETLQIRVAGMDAGGNLGLASLPSDVLLFDETGVSIQPQAGAPAAASAGAPGEAEGSAGVQTAAATSSDSRSPAGTATGSGSDSDSGTAAGAGESGDESARTSRLDFGGDGASDLLWQGDTLLRVTRIDGSALVTEAIFDRAPAEWELVGMADFDADGLVDLLWAKETGELALSDMAETLANAPTLALEEIGALGDGEAVAATGDYDGDGSADVLVNHADGALSLWQSLAGTAPSVTILSRQTPANAAVAGSGDYDGDGRADILWQNEAGQHVVWFMNGATLREVAAVAGPAGDVLASGDFDGDGVDDVAQRGPDGAVSLLLLGGGVGAPVVESGFAAMDGWSLVGSGDYDGDEVGDLLWQQGPELSLWRIGPDLAVPVGPETDPNWSLVPDWR